MLDLDKEFIWRKDLLIGIYGKTTNIRSGCQQKHRGPEEAKSFTVRTRRRQSGIIN